VIGVLNRSTLASGGSTVKLILLLALPSRVITLINPVVALLGTAVLISVGEML